ncbi:MAG: DUF58 domain-containing protein, partial [Bacteroidota bacterium]
SLVVIFTDLFENVESHEALISALKHLRHCKHEVILFHVMEEGVEKLLDLEHERYVLQDLETGEELEISPELVKEDYRGNLNLYIHNFRQACNEFHIDFESITTERSFDQALLHFLNKRRRLS